MEQNIEVNPAPNYWDGETLPLIGGFRDDGYPIPLDCEETKAELQRLQERDRIQHRWRSADEMDEECTRVHRLNTIYRLHWS
ncbi:hypothetical protein GCM10009688_18770 [Arthrobacter gandavensis]|uniref:Uncharacterized protein n=1 Tax=Arthrobacter gandavensis TaxID=169960 RepID=A0ABP5AHK8_9MICC|nr:hypothetical protein [Arthrobacter citreus]